MPESNLPFPILPAQIDLATVLQRREIEQSQVDILDQNICCLNAMDQRIELFKILNQIAECTIAAIPCRFLNRWPGLRLILEDLLSNGLDFIHPGTDQIQSFVRFLKSKVSL